MYVLLDHCDLTNVFYLIFYLTAVTRGIQGVFELMRASGGDLSERVNFSVFVFERDWMCVCLCVCVEGFVWPVFSGMR